MGATKAGLETGADLGAGARPLRCGSICRFVAVADGRMRSMSVPVRTSQSCRNQKWCAALAAFGVAGSTAGVVRFA